MVATAAVFLVFFLLPGDSCGCHSRPETLAAQFEGFVSALGGTMDRLALTLRLRPLSAGIFDALYVWDYIARPYRLVPSVAAGMPEISPDGRTWRIRVKPGIYFASDPAFGGKRRELTAHDFVYSWKRVVDPRVHSPTADLVEGKLVGLDAAIAKARTSGRFDYDTEIEGLKALDRYTLQLTLVEPDYTLLPYLVFPPLRAVAREVVEKYGDASAE